jgi:hypothetical protein
MLFLFLVSFSTGSPIMSGLRSTFLSYTNHAPLFTGYTREEAALLPLLSSQHFLDAVNTKGATTLTRDDLAKLFEAYTSSQWPVVNPDQTAFFNYCVTNAGRVRRPRDVPRQRTKLPHLQSFMAYPEVESSAGGRGMEKDLR